MNRMGKDRPAAAGRRMIIGIKGTDLDKPLRNHLERIKPAGIIIFERNAENHKQLKSFISRIKEFLPEITGSPPYICIDHEGGRINRLPFLGRIESPAEIGNLADENLISSWVKRLNEPLVDLGFNLNLAPCLDLYTNEGNACLRGRCFSDVRGIVSKAAKIFVKKSKKMGIMTCGKHFPGLGAAGKDTHDEKAVIDKTEDELSSNDLVPFREAIDAGIEFIMVNHAVYPKIDLLPASLSSKIAKGILRDKLGFKGKIITDDLYMKGITNYFPPEEFLKKAISAGADLLLICHDPSFELRCHQIIEDLTDVP